MRGFIYIQSLILGSKRTMVALCAFTTAGLMKKASRPKCQERIDSFDKFNIIFVPAFQRVFEKEKNSERKDKISFPK